MTTSTAAVVLTCAWAGALLGAAVPHVAPLVGGVAVSVVGIVAGLRRRWLLAAVCLAVATVSATGAAVRIRAVVDGPLARHVDDRHAVRAELVAVDDPRTVEGGGRWVLARLSRATVGAGQVLTTRERVVVQIPDGVGVEYGAAYRLRGVASMIEGPAAGYFASLGAVVQIDPVELVRTRAPPAWQHATTWLRGRVATAARQRLAIPEASLLTGLVTGDVSAQPDEVADDVRAAGLSHLVAVSGSNVAIVVGGTLGLCLLVGLGRRRGWWIALVVVWWFAVLVRLEPSVVRAGAMATVVLVALLIGRLRSTPHLLCSAGTVVLLADPMLASRLGFVLSMAATAGVVVASPAVAVWLGRLAWMPAGVRLVLAATVSAQLAVAPVLLVVDGDVHAASVPANLLAVPAASVASLVGVVMAVVATVSADLAGGVALLAVPFLGVVLRSARWFANPGVREVVAFVAWAVAATAMVLGLARLPGRWRAAGVVVAVVSVVGVAVPPLLHRSGGGAPTQPVLVALDVGQGDALLLGDPVGGWLLVDGGPDPEIAAELLAERGIVRLAAVVATHSDSDHVGGLDAVLGAVDVGAMIIGPRGEAAETLTAAAEDTGTPVVVVGAGDAWPHGAMTVTVLSPPHTGLGDGPNENSLVLHVDVPGGRSVLLTGDAEVIAQSLLADDPLIDVDVLKVPHHGGATNADGFLAATTPEVAVISVGADNDFGHPHPAVLADLDGIQVHRTDVDGTVEVPLTSGVTALPNGVTAPQ